MNTKPQTVSKFKFDTEFRQGGEGGSNANRARQRKSLTQEEIDTMCAKAREAGIHAGQVRAQEAIAANVEALTAQLRRSIEDSTVEIVEVRAEAARLALAAASALAGAALASFAVDEVERVLGEALTQAIGEPRITLRAAPNVAEALESRIESIAHDRGFDGRIHLAVDPAMQGADCRIEWRGGGAERRQENIEADIAAVIERHFSQTAITTGTKG